MFTTVLKEVSGYLDKRFFSSIVVPCLAFWTLMVSLYVVVHGVSPTLATWQQWSFTTQAFLIGLFFGWGLFFAYLLANFLTALTRLYEGYWDHVPGLRRIAESRRERYRQELRFLKQQIESQRHIQRDLEARLQASSGQAEREHINAQLKKAKAARTEYFSEIYYRFPPATREESVMATRMGNIFKNAELYPFLRYEIDAVLLWPRLYQTLPESFATTLADAKSSLDFMLVVSFLSFWFAVIGSALVLIAGSTPTLFLIVYGGGLIVSWLAYRSALEAALNYGQMIKAAFDLHRDALITALGLKAPTSIGQERMLWRNINAYIYRGNLETPDDFEYAPSVPPQEQDS